MAGRHWLTLVSNQVGRAFVEGIPQILHLPINMDNLFQI